MRPTGLKPVEICRGSGLLPSAECRRIPEMITTEYATTGQVPSGPCDIHGGGVRSYARDVDQDEWPRAAAAVDLTHIRPIQVNAPTLLAQSDLYKSVNPVLRGGGGDDSIKVARATTPDGKDPGRPDTNQPTNTLAGQPGSEKEVRRAEPVRPMDLPSGAPVMTLPVPKAAEF